jgi:hypothetical protein
LVLLLGIIVVRDARSQGTQLPTRAFPPVPSDAQAPQAHEETVAPTLEPPPPTRVPWSLPPPVWQPTADDPRDEPARDRWDDRPLLVEAHLGFGTPYGLLGAALAADIARYFGFVVGGGHGMSGLQIAMGVRARVPLTGVAFGAELSWSGGPYEGRCYVGCPGIEQLERPTEWTFAHWINIAPAIDLRTEGGFNARIYGGYAGLLNVSDGICH